MAQHYVLPLLIIRFGCCSNCTELGASNYVATVWPAQIPLNSFGMNWNRKFIAKVFSGVQVWTLCKPIKSFRTGLSKPIIHGPHCEHWLIAMLK